MMLRIFIVVLVLLFIQLIPNNIAFADITAKKTFREPENIQIPSLKINLPVEISKIKDSEWLITDKMSAFFGDTSAYPGIKGTTIIFAHARQGLFVLLPMLKEKDLIVLQTRYGLYYYRVSEKKIVSPSDVFFLNQETGNKNVLAVFTCYGSSDAKRIVFFAPLQIAIPNSGFDKFGQSFI